MKKKNWMLMNGGWEKSTVNNCKKNNNFVSCFCSSKQLRKKKNKKNIIVFIFHVILNLIFLFKSFAKYHCNNDLIANRLV